MKKEDVPVISIVGRSHAGKTTLIEKVVCALKTLGYRVATIKHGTHEFELDRKGKDTWRHHQAGADTVMVASKGQLALFKWPQEDPDLEELVEYITDVDIILTEGYKGGIRPKIEVFREEPPLCLGDKGLVAVAGPTRPQEAVDIPFFHIDDGQGVARFIVKRFLTRATQTLKTL